MSIRNCLKKRVKNTTFLKKIINAKKVKWFKEIKFSIINKKKMMNLFFDLPEELQREIYKFDSTYRDVMNNCLKELKMNNCLKDLKECMKYYVKAREIVENAYNIYEEFGPLNVEREDIKFFEFIMNVEEYHSERKRRLRYRHPFVTIEIIS